MARARSPTAHLLSLAALCLLLRAGSGSRPSSWNANDSDANASDASDAAARRAAGCTSALDCSLNGKCAAGVCQCLPQWHGAECGQLNLLPIPSAISGKRDVNSSTHKNISSWGGSVQRGEDGTWHMWSAEMAANCGIGAWLSNSIIAHSTSKEPDGQYVRQSETWPVFAHEPVVAKAPTGEFVMYFTSTNYMGIGDDLYPYTAGQTPVNGGRDGFCTSCPGDGSSGRSCHAGRNWSMPLPTYMSYTLTPEGNWSAPVAVPRVQQAPLIDSNLSPIIFPNGSLLGLWRNDDDRGSIHAATASDWRDPNTYVQHTEDLFSHSGGLPSLDAALEGVEDPYLWRAKDGSFHLLVHGNCGYHAFSEDGLRWHTSPNGSKTCAFPRENVPHQGGGTVTFARRERPHLILGSDGFTPVALSSSVTMNNGGDHSWTQIQKISDQPPQEEQKKDDDSGHSSTAESASRDIHSTAAAAAVETESLAGLGGPGAGLVNEPFSCDGGNVMMLSACGGSSSGESDSSSMCATAEISRTGLEGLIGFKHGPDAEAQQHLSFTADDFAVNLTVTAEAPRDDDAVERTQTQIELRSKSNTDSRRFCALMSACSNSTVAQLVYRCQESGGDWPHCSGYCNHLHYQVRGSQRTFSRRKKSITRRFSMRKSYQHEKLATTL